MTDNMQDTKTQPRNRPPFQWRQTTIGRILSRPAPTVALSFLVLVVGCVLLAQWIAPYPPLAQDLLNASQGPSPTHWLGTDNLGRDVLSRLLYGGQSTVLNVLLVASVAFVVGVPLGIVAGYAGGTTDRIISRATELLFAIPVLIILLVILSVFGNQVFIAMIALGILLSAPMVRVVRGAVQSVKPELYIDAARVAGLGRLQIMVRHVFPAVSGPIIVNMTLIASATVLMSSTLAFLGLGVTPPAPSWGGMISEGATVLASNPWPLIPPGVLLTAIVLTLGLLGDGIRDALAERWSSSASQIKRARRRKRPVGVRSAEAVEMPRNPMDEDLDLAADSVLSIRELTVDLVGGQRPLPVLENVSFEVRAGRTLGIVGESGCGKSLTALAMLGLLPSAARVSGGKILFAGKDLLSEGEAGFREVRGCRIGYVAQDPLVNLDPMYTVGSLLREAMRMHKKLTRQQTDAEVIRLLETVRLDNPKKVAASYPHQLSGGMAQRVAMALALVGDPEVLIADEPTTALDVSVQAEVLELLRELQTTRNMAIVMVTHDWGVVADLCHDVVVMYAGQVIEAASAEQIFDQPRHPYTQGLLRANPERAERGVELPAIAGRVPPPGLRPDHCHFADRCALATSSCRASQIALQTAEPGHTSRCIHTELLVEESPTKERTEANEPV